jgi:PAS domain S-box-containing protein
MRFSLIRSKLLLGFAFVVSIVLIQGWVEHRRSMRVEKVLGEAYRTAASESDAAEHMFSSATRLYFLLERLPEKGPSVHPDIERAMVALRKAVDEAFVAAQKARKNAEQFGEKQQESRELGLLADIEGLGTTLTKMEEIWNRYTAGNTEMPAVKMDLIDTIHSEIYPRLYRYHDESHKSLAEQGKAALSLMSTSRDMLLASTLGAVIAALIVCYLIGRAIVRPLSEIISATKAVEGGDRERRIVWDRDDEFGQVAAATNQMLDSLEAATHQREELEAKASEHARELDRFFNLSADMMSITDFSGRFLRVNGAFERVLGYSLPEILERSLFDFLHPEDFEVTATELEKYQKTGGASACFENRLRHKDGSWRYLSWNAVPVRASELIYGVARDITEQRLAHEAEQRRTKRMLQFQRALLQLRDSVHGNLDAFFHSATEECAKSLDVERVSIWNFNDATSEIVCVDQYILSKNEHTSGSRLSREQLPSYFGVIEKLEPVVADDALSHQATTELRDCYLAPLGISSMLDVPMKAAGRLVGVICCEHVGPARKWSDEEVKFVCGISGSIMIAIERQERMEAEEKLRVSEEYNRGIVQSTQDCVKMLSLDGLLLDMAEPGRRAMGIVDFEPYRGTDWVSVWHGSDREMARQALKDACAGGIGRFSGYCPTVDGQPKWWDVIVSAVYDRDGKPATLLAISRDITELREKEETLRNFNATLEQRIEERSQELAANEERFQLMVEQVVDYAIFMLDPSGIVSSWNIGVQRAKGYTSEEVIGRHFSIFFTEEDLRNGLPDALLKQAGEIGYVTNEGWRVRKDGSRFWAEATISALRDSSGTLRGFVKVTRDLTERLKGETTLKEALARQTELTRKAQAGEHAKSEFLAVMSHEVRTPMNGIIGYADLLARATDLPSEYHEYAKTIDQSARALLRILDDILEFSSSEAGTLTVEKAGFSPRKVANEVHQLLLPAAHRKGLALILESPGELPGTVMGDAGRLRQILLNLVGNAVKFTKTGSVTVRIHPPQTGSMWTFAVRDTGEGIPEDRRAAIFDPFTQADASTSRKYGGTGLGLAISKRLAELMGGSLTVQNIPGAGAEFLVSLPLDPLDQPLSESHDEADEFTLGERFASKHPLSILVAEDDRVNLKLTLTILRKLGYSPLAAVNGRDAVSIYQESRPSCILMDLQMPEMDGIEATKAIRAIERESLASPVYIAALTANTAGNDRVRCIEAGMSGYLNKPIRKDQLSSMLAEASQVCSAAEAG